MRKIIAYVCFIGFMSTSALFSFVPPAPAQNIEGKWGFGIRAGVSVSPQDLANSVLFAGDTVETDTGPLVSGNILYGINRNFSVGLNVEWETHSIDLSVVGPGGGCWDWCWDWRCADHLDHALRGDAFPDGSLRALRDIGCRHQYQFL